MNKSLRRLDAVKDVETDWQTQISNVTLKKGFRVDFSEVADAIDKAGFTAGAISISAEGFVSFPPSGPPAFRVSGSNQVFPIAENERLSALRKAGIPEGKEVQVEARVEFGEKPPRLVLSALPARAKVEAEQAVEVGKVMVDGVEVSLGVQRPLTPEQLEAMMRRMAGPGAMEGMGRPPMPRRSMEGMRMEGRGAALATHYMGVVIADARTKEFIPNLKVSLRAIGRGQVREANLMPMQGSYANNVALPGKGGYQIVVQISRRSMMSMDPGKEGAMSKPLEAIFEFNYR